MIKKILLATVILMMFSIVAHSQDTSELLGQVTNIYTGSDGSSAQGLIAGFSVWGLVGGMLFGGVGFVAFMYGKKNSEFRPMIIGVALMVYPYFLRGTILLFLVGIGLTAALYFFRE